MWLSALLYSALLICCSAQNVEFSGTVQFNNEPANNQFQLQRFQLESVINNQTITPENQTISPDNSFLLTGVVPGEYIVIISFRSALDTSATFFSFCYRYSVGPWNLTTSKTDQTIIVTLTSVNGVIQDSDSSSPITNAILNGQFYNPVTTRVECEFKAKSGSDGTYSVAVVPNIPYNKIHVDLKKGEQTTYSEYNGFPPMTFSAATNTKNFALTPGIQVNGVVRYSDGLPVQISEMAAFTVNTRVLQGPNPIFTDSEGKFSIFLPKNQQLSFNGTVSLFPPGATNVATQFYIRNYCYGTIDTTTTQSSLNVQFFVNDTIVEITVNDQLGFPAANVNFRASIDVPSVSATGVTGSNGKFSIRTLPYIFETVSVFPSLSNSNLYVATPCSPGSLSETPYTIYSPIVVSGNVYYSNGKMALAGSVEQGISGAGYAEISNGTYNANFCPGNYSVAMLNSWRNNQMSYQGVYVSELSLSESATIDWKIPVVTISGYIVNATGSPVPFTYIYGSQPGPRLPFPSTFNDYEIAVYALTNSEGFFSFFCTPGEYGKAYVSPAQDSDYYGRTPLPNQQWTSDTSNLKYTIL